jgi:hypothetical protein
MIQLHSSEQNPALFLENIEQFLSSNEKQRLIIRKDTEGKYHFNLKPHSFLQRADHDSLKNLKEIIGSKRLERIFLRKELNLNVRKLLSDKVNLTQEVVHKIFIGLSDVRREDLEEQAHFEGKDLKKLNVIEIDDLTEKLFPISKVSQLFFRHCKSINYLDVPYSCGKGFIGLQERVWTIITARETFRQKNADVTALKIYEAEMLTSRLADREPTLGTVIRLREGYYSVDRIFTKGGAYVSVIKSMSNPSKAIVICRGTASRPAATGAFLSGINNILKEMGFFAVKSIWHDLKKYLSQSQIEEIDVMGKSQGGAHAQYLITLLLGKSSQKVNSLTTYCGVGVPGKVQETFEKIIKFKNVHKPKILILRNSGEDAKNQVDYIPLYGGVHVHTPDTTEVYYITPADSQKPIEFIPRIRRIGQVWDKLLKSFKWSHCRQTTLQTFTIFKKDDIENDVNSGMKLEPLRRRIAGLINILTLGFANRISFVQFYEKVGV